MEKGFSSILNFSRWFSAFLVLIHHVRHIVFVDLKDVDNKSYFLKLFYFFTGLGHEAVVIFFVLSGLLVGGLTLEKWRTRTVNDMIDYSIHRFSRIYIVFIPALVIGYAFDQFGLTLFDSCKLYSNPSQYNNISLNTVIKDNLGLKNIVGNLLMLQNIKVEVLGSNGPLWSLAYEWWYYTIWAAIILTIYSKGIGKWVSLVFLGFLVVNFPIKIWMGMLVWLLGVALFFYQSSNLPKPHPIVGISLLISAFLVSRISAHEFSNLVGYEKLYIDFTRDFGLGLAYSIALISIRDYKNPLFLDGIHKKLASFSYSLYLVHFPAMLFVIAYAKQVIFIGFLQQPSMGSFLYFLMIVIFLYLYSYIFYYFTERHTYKLVSLLNGIFRN